MASVPQKTEIGLVLQGGGALGAYECGGVAALLELIETATAGGKAITLKSVVGVSIGAINAACVVGAASPAEARRRLEALWDDLTLLAPGFWPRAVQRDLSLFGLPGFYRPRSDFMRFARWTSYYDTEPLRATLERHVDFTALNASTTFFTVTAVNVESGELVRFCNRPLDGEPAVKIEPSHVMASGSLPPQFPWTEIADAHYWDGGLVDNAPLGDAIDAFSYGDDVRRLLIVMDLYPLQSRLPTTLAEVDDRLHELSFGNRLRQDRATAKRVNDFVATIEKLAAQVPAENLTPDLADSIARARRFKTIEVVNVDMQVRLRDGRPGAQDRSDDEFGLRDFSSDTVRRRRETGYRLAREALAPHILGAA